MDGTNSLPNDLTECHQLLAAAYQQSVQLETKVATSQQQAAELNRVLNETAASFEELKQEHAAALDELAWYKRWAFGRRLHFRHGRFLAASPARGWSRKWSSASLAIICRCTAWKTFSRVMAYTFREAPCAIG